MAKDKMDGGNTFDRKKVPGKRTVGQVGKNAKDQGDTPEGYFSTHKTIAEHKVANDDTLSAIALHYYGKSTRSYWTVIYNANKAIIGDDPGVLKPGITLKIPELPANLKD